MSGKDPNSRHRRRRRRRRGRCLRERDRDREINRRSYGAQQWCISGIFHLIGVDSVRIQYIHVQLYEFLCVRVRVHNIMLCSRAHACLRDTAYYTI